MTTKTLNVEIEEETLQTLDHLAQWLDASRVEVVQRLLREGARQARLEYAAGLYRCQEVTLERVAEIAGVLIYDMMAYVRQHDIPGPSRADEMRADVATMLMRSGRPDVAESVIKGD